MEFNKTKLRTLIEQIIAPKWNIRGNPTSGFTFDASHMEATKFFQEEILYHLEDKPTLKRNLLFDEINQNPTIDPEAKSYFNKKVDQDNGKRLHDIRKNFIDGINSVLRLHCQRIFSQEIYKDQPENLSTEKRQIVFSSFIMMVAIPRIVTDIDLKNKLLRFDPIFRPDKKIFVIQLIPWPDYFQFMRMLSQNGGPYQYVDVREAEIAINIYNAYFLSFAGKLEKRFLDINKPLPSAYNALLPLA